MKRMFARELDNNLFIGILSTQLELVFAHCTVFRQQRTWVRGWVYIDSEKCNIDVLVSSRTWRGSFCMISSVAGTGLWELEFSMICVMIWSNAGWKKKSETGIAFHLGFDTHLLGWKHNRPFSRCLAFHPWTWMSTVDWPDPRVTLDIA